MELNLSSATSTYWLNQGRVLHKASIVDKVSNYTLEGIKAHKAAASYLNGESVDEDCSIHILNYLEYISQLKLSCNGDYKESIECPLKSISKDFPLKGIVDYFLMNIKDKHLHIVDFKYGKATKVVAKNNSQLLIYAYLIFKKLGFSVEVEKVTIHIYQPRINNVRLWTISIEELIEKIGELYKKYKKIRNIALLEKLKTL